MPHEFIADLKDAVAEGIPSSAAIVGEVIKIIYDQSSSAADLATIIERDPPLTAKILKISNSAYYGSSKQITSLQRAVVVLGFDTIKELVTTISVVHSFFQSGTTGGVDKPGLWLHSVGTAKAAQLIAQRHGLARPDVTYTVGLLHDIGKIVTALIFPEQYNRVVEHAIENELHIIQSERMILNIDHCMIGKILCDLWDLPDALSNAILYHHEPLNTEGENTLAQITYLGDHMARKVKIGNPGDNFITEPDLAVLKILGKTPKDVIANYKSVYTEFLAEKEELIMFFSGLK